jgi:hypothetical protein
MGTITGMDFDGGFRRLSVIWVLRGVGVQYNVAWNRGVAIILRGSDCALVGDGTVQVGDQYQKGGEGAHRLRALFEIM